MRKIKEALRLHASGLSTRKIAASLGVGQSTASDYLKRVHRAGLSWPLAAEMTDAALEVLLFHPTGGPTRLVEAQPDWPMIHRELRRPGVTLSLLWEEYRAVRPEGYGYSRFCDLYRRWSGRLTPVMRQHHVAGERVFVDYAGTTLEVIDAATGEVRQAQLFVAALGASNLTYAEASWSQGLSDWIGAHGRAFGYFGGVPAQVVSDNLKSGVTRACFYEPAVNRTYADMAAHYGTAVVPARPRIRCAGPATSPKKLTKAAAPDIRNVSATPRPYAARLDGCLKRHGMRSSMPLCGWPSRMARRVGAR